MFLATNPLKLSLLPQRNLVYCYNTLEFSNLVIAFNTTSCSEDKTKQEPCHEMVVTSSPILPLNDNVDDTAVEHCLSVSGTSNSNQTDSESQITPGTYMYIQNYS